jgi:hypothetical protein
MISRSVRTVFCATAKKAVDAALQIKAATKSMLRVQRIAFDRLWSPPSPVGMVVAYAAGHSQRSC